MVLYSEFILYCKTVIQSEQIMLNCLSISVLFGFLNIN